MEAVLFAGFMIGMMHAVEADHVAAVASLATRSRKRGEAVRMGLAWGLGHTVTLFCLGAIVISLNTVVAPRVATALELLVGVMLVGLGLGVLHRNLRSHDPVGPHGPQTGGSRAGDDPARASGLPKNSLAVGLLHGLAGSAALVVLTLDSVGSLSLAALYIALFGIGSMIGMAILSLAIAVPLQFAAKGLARAHRYMILGIGLATVALGCWTIYSGAVDLGVIAA